MYFCWDDLTPLYLTLLNTIYTLNPIYTFCIIEEFRIPARKPGSASSQAGNGIVARSTLSPIATPPAPRDRPPHAILVRSTHPNQLGNPVQRHPPCDQATPAAGPHSQIVLTPPTPSAPSGRDFLPRSTRRPVRILLIEDMSHSADICIRRVPSEGLDKDARVVPNKARHDAAGRRFVGIG